MEISRFELIMYRTQRFFIRCGRVLVGTVFLVIGLWAGSAALDAASTPFAASSLLTLIKALGTGALAISFVWLGLATAFGEAPDERQQILRDTEAKAKASAAAQAATVALREQAARELAAKDAKWAGKPRWLRTLFHPHTPALQLLSSTVFFCAFLCVLAAVMYLIVWCSR